MFTYYRSNEILYIHTHISKLGVVVDYSIHKNNGHKITAPIVSCISNWLNSLHSQRVTSFMSSPIITFRGRFKGPKYPR